MMKFYFFVVGFMSSLYSYAQPLNMMEIIKGVKAGNAKALMELAIKNGYTDPALTQGNEIDWAGEDEDVEIPAYTYRASQFKNGLTERALTVDSFSISRHIQAVYTAPTGELENWHASLIKESFEKRKDTDLDIWEKEGVVVEFSLVINDVYVYLKKSHK